VYLTKINTVLQLHSCGNLRFLTCYRSIFFYFCLFVVIYLSVLFIYIIQQGAQIPVTMLLWQLNFVLMGPQHETCLMSWFRYLELLGGS